MANEFKKERLMIFVILLPTAPESIHYEKGPANKWQIPLSIKTENHNHCPNISSSFFVIISPRKSLAMITPLGSNRKLEGIAFT